MAMQPIDRQKAKHNLTVQKRTIGLTQAQKQKLAEHEAFKRECKWLREINKMLGG